MKRLHIHINVDDLQRSIAFYSTLFGVKPTTEKADYARWKLDDPQVNFAISTRERQAGLDHFGIQVESEDDLTAITDRLKGVDAGMYEQKQATCCYAVSDKTWSADPQGMAWEIFYTYGDATEYGEDTLEARNVAGLVTGNAAAKSRAGGGKAGACCGPREKS